MEGPNISFVTWPDGKVSSESLTVAGEQMAKAHLIATWLPEMWFGNIPDAVFHYLWRGMEEKGFRSHTIKIGEDGEPTITDDF